MQDSSPRPFYHRITERVYPRIVMPLLILFAVVYGLVLLATPILAISLYVRNAKLRKQLNDLAEENAKQLTKLQRAVGELQIKAAAAAPSAATAAERPVTTETRHPVPVPRSFPQVHIPPAVVVSPRVEVQPPIKPQPTPPIPVTEKKPEPASVPPITVTPPIVPTPQAPSSEA